MMPGLDGFTILERLRTSAVTRDLPVIVMTAKDLTPEEKRRLSEEAQCIITKGTMDRDYLFRELSAALNRLEQELTDAATADRPRILVVEDNRVAVLQIRSAFEDRGYGVTVAKDGAEALATFSHMLPDVIVLDLMMPGIDGLQVLEQIRSTPWTTNVPVVVLTAKELTSADLARLKHGNVQELAQKGSMNRDELIACVEHQIHRPPVRKQGSSPSNKPVEECKAASARPEGFGPSNEEKTILVVEDNPDNMFTITEILNEMGCTYITAEDGLQGLRLAKTSKPALIIMDIQLPGLSGIDVTKQIRATTEISDTPIIAMTARAMHDERERILAVGCDAYLSKPLVAEEAITLIRKCLESSEERL